ncbi:hypothetical protein PCANB_000935 [Pneumocystis canis]|nr:hypothetical protein PCANB_000935 [Pneumocystis canis]
MSDIRNWILGEGLPKKNGTKRTKNENTNGLNENKKAKKRIVLSDNEEIIKEDKKENKKRKEIRSIKDHDLIPTNASQFFADKNKISRSSPVSKKADSKSNIVQENYIDDDDDFLFSQSDLVEFEKLDEISKNEANKQNLSKTLNSEHLKSDTFNVNLESDNKFLEKSEKTNIDTFSSTTVNISSNIESTEHTPVSKQKRNMKNKRTPQKKSGYIDLTVDKEKKNFENAIDPAQKVLDECPLISLSDIKVSEAKKINFYEQTNHNSLQPHIFKEIPGLTFVFTGILKTIDREEGCNLIKKYGGKVATAPSSKTSFVVLGEDAGPKKIEVIKKNNLKTINEDGLFYLIKNMPALGGNSKAAQAAQKKREEEDREIHKIAESMIPKSQGIQKSQSYQLWTTKYAPQTFKEICGNKSLVEKLQKWDKNRIANFKNPGSDGIGLYRSVLISGPPGIGKTTSAHLVAKLEGYDILEFNASDTRNKKLLEESLNKVYNNTSLNGFFSTQGNALEKKKNRFVIIMDEVDGVSSGDSGGIGELNSFIKKTQIPIICICNDRASRKLLPLDRTTFDLKFRRPDANSLRSRIMSIAYREGLKLEPHAIDQLTQYTHGDIRQIINILFSWKLTQNFMNIDDGSNAAKVAEKDIVMKPWDIVGKFLNGGIFKHTSKVTLNDKIEFYFNDHELSHLMLQENYLKTQPDTLNSIINSKQKNYEHLKLIEKASEAISQSDLIDSMIHGPQQHWSLMPVHAIFSCVIPAFFVSGFGTSQYSFTSVLGNIAKANKLIRYLQNIHAHMSLKITGNYGQVRQFYIPLLFDLLLRRLEIKGQDAVSDIIKLMDEYFLTKEDSEYILELSIGPNNANLLKIPTQAKVSFTKHTITSNKSSIVHNTPDIENIIETTNFDDLQESVSENEDDLKKDKFIITNKKPNKKPAKGGVKKPKKVSTTTKN